MGLTDFNSMSLPECCRALVPDAEITRVIEAALVEDGVLAGDITSEVIIPPNRKLTADLVAREGGVLAGMDVLGRAVDLLPFSSELQVDGIVDDGQPVRAGDVLGCMRGYWRDLLTLERVFLNLLSHLSGIATMTSRYVHAVAGTGVQVCDSRKTTPGLRSLEKYAVACGGGCLHRIGLHDALMFKDNHLASVPPGALADSLADAIDMAKEDRPLRFTCVEVDDLDQLRTVLEIQENRVDIVLLDNMGPASLREAVSLRNAASSSILLEASGGITLDTISAVAATGIDRISVGALTHGARWMDIGLDIHIEGNA